MGFAATFQAEVCIRDLAKFCDYVNFESALFRCSWQKTEQFSKNCNELFEKTFNYIYLRDRPVSEFVTPPFKKSAQEEYFIQYEKYKIAFEKYLKSNAKLSLTEYIKLTENYKK